jgi:hypothetical protein
MSSSPAAMPSSLNGGGEAITHSIPEESLDDEVEDSTTDGASSIGQTIRGCLLELQLFRKLLQTFAAEKLTL